MGLWEKGSMGAKGPEEENATHLGNGECCSLAAAENKLLMVPEESFKVGRVQTKWNMEYQ